jgi:hypothetical protein
MCEPESGHGVRQRPSAAAARVWKGRPTRLLPLGTGARFAPDLRLTNALGRAAVQAQQILRAVLFQCEAPR